MEKPRTSVVEYVISSLTEEIVRGELKPGDRIPTESELVETLGVSRNPVREAVKILCYAGVLEIRRADGTYVCREFSGKVLNPVLYGVLLSRQDATELRELQLMLETGLACQAAEKRSGPALKVLEERYEALRTAFQEERPDAENVDAACQAFWDAVGEAGQNRMASRIEAYVRAITASARRSALRSVLEGGGGDALCCFYGDLLALIQDGETEDLYETVKETLLEND